MVKLVDTADSKSAGLALASSSLATSNQTNSYNQSTTSIGKNPYGKNHQIACSMR